MHDTLQLHDVEPSEQMVRRLAAALVESHEGARAELAATGRVLPSAKETLAALAADPRVHQAVLSGNLRAVSRIKLEVFGLDSYLDLASSAYGDDHIKRPELVTIARQRATERTAATFDKQHTVLIGDTPHDVAAALTAGVRIIAVASGNNDDTELAQAGAPVTVSDLTHTAIIVQLWLPMDYKRPLSDRARRSSGEKFAVFADHRVSSRVSEDAARSVLPNAAASSRLSGTASAQVRYTRGPSGRPWRITAPLSISVTSTVGGTPAGLAVTVLGSGGPYLSPTRVSSGYAVSLDGCPPWPTGSTPRTPPCVRLPERRGTLMHARASMHVCGLLSRSATSSTAR